MKSTKPTAIVVGTGAGGATIANELQGRYQVTMLEAGGEFHPFSLPVDTLAKFRSTGLFFDERMIRLLFPNMLVEKSQRMVMVRGIGVGGTTTLATGNALRYDGALREIGIDLDSEFEELNETLPITTDHRQYWNDSAEKMFALFEEMDLDPVVTPKFLNPRQCAFCSHCAIGCPTEAKWDTRELVEEAMLKGAKLITHCKVKELKISGNEVKEVHANRLGKKMTFHGDLVVLAAGGFGTPVILEKSGIACENSLFVDPVLCVAGPLEDFFQNRQLLMPFISQQDGYILSPYMDYLSFFFHKKWRMPMKDMVSVMIKLQDDEKGSIHGRKIDKTLTDKDKNRMKRAVAQSREIVTRLGVERDKQFLGILNAGHPGGMLPLNEQQKDTLHDDRLPENLYVADATILPKAMGNPPILTIMALSKKISKLIMK